MTLARSASRTSSCQSSPRSVLSRCSARVHRPKPVLLGCLERLCFLIRFHHKRYVETEHDHQRSHHDVIHSLPSPFLKVCDRTSAHHQRPTAAPAPACAHTFQLTVLSGFGTQPSALQPAPHRQRVHVTTRTVRTGFHRPSRPSQAPACLSRLAAESPLPAQAAACLTPA